MEQLDEHHKRILLSYSDDVDVLNFCLSNKKIGDDVCNEDFWKNRFLNKYGNFDKGNISWKNFYMYIVSIKDEANRKKRSPLYYAIKTRNKQVLDFFLNIKNRTQFDYLEGLEAAAEINDVDLIDIFLKNRKRPNDLNLYHYYLRDNGMNIMKGAIYGGHKNIIEKYLSKTRVLNRYDFINLIKLAIENNEDEIAIYLYKESTYNMEKTSKARGEINDELLYFSVENKNVPFIKYFMKEGGDVNVGLKAAVKIDNSELIQYFLSRGAKFNKKQTESKEKYLSYMM
jgi:hypothetical protein